MEVNPEVIELYDKTLHDLKFLVNDIAVERRKHHQQLRSLIRKHNIKINKMIKKSLKIMEELNELYLALFKQTEEGQNGKSR